MGEALPAHRADAVADARTANLRYVSDELPGIQRVNGKNGFRYRWPDGKAVRDRSTVERIKRLAIPPAYTGVWICPFPNGHIQATGRDARGRKQYRYHQRWREVRDASKFERLLDFATALPRIRATVASDLHRHGMPKEKILAAVVTLLETTLIRVGNDEYVRANDSYGLTTLRNAHVRVRGSHLRFRFRGKSGIPHQVDLHDRRLARIVERCQDLPGQQLFGYVDENGDAVAIDSADVNEYIRAVSSDDYSAKDFRTWLATVSCFQWLAANPAESLSDRRHAVVEACRAVAKRLRNTPAICRTCYIHPSVVERYLETGSLASDPSDDLEELSAAERLTLKLLRSSLRRQT